MEHSLKIGGGSAPIIITFHEDGRTTLAWRKNSVPFTSLDFRAALHNVGHPARDSVSWIRSVCERVIVHTPIYIPHAVFGSLIEAMNRHGQPWTAEGNEFSIRGLTIEAVHFIRGYTARHEDEAMDDINKLEV